MHWSDWVIVVFFIISSLATIGIVGKPRKPIESSTAVGVSVINGAMIVMILLTHGRLGNG